MTIARNNRSILRRASDALVVLGATALIINLVLALVLTHPVGATHVTPILLEGPSNQGKTCSDLAGSGQSWTEFKLEGGSLSNGFHTDGALGVTISSLTDDTFDWSSNIGVDAVIVKGGEEGSYLYKYDPPFEETSDTGLGVPEPDENSISHISFCYDVDPPAPGSITVFKETDPDGGTGFDFTGDLGNFSLDDDQSNVVGGLVADDYDVIETVPAGSDLTSVECTGGDSSSITDGVTIHLDPGEDITCTFTNTLITGSITVEKDVLDSDGKPIDDPTTFTALLDGGGGQSFGEGSPTLFANLSPGTYSITEILSGGYTLDSIVGDENAGTSDAAEVTLDPGENATVTFVNRQPPPQPPECALVSVVLTKTLRSTAAPAIFTFTPVADAYVDEGRPTTNFGGSTSLRTDASPDKRSYLRFSVQGMGGTVVRATLRLYANSSHSVGYDARGVTDNTWGEMTITYSNAPAVGSVLGSSGGFGAGTWTEVDVTAFIGGNGTYSFALTTPSSTATNLASRESGANVPQLIIETGGGPLTTVDFTATVTGTFLGTASYEWDVDNDGNPEGTTFDGNTFSWDYRGAGSFTAAVLVTDLGFEGDGQCAVSDTDSVTINTQPPPQPEVGNIAACADGLNAVVVGSQSVTPSVEGEWLTLVGFAPGTYTVTSGSRSASVTVVAGTTQAPSEADWGECTGGPTEEVLGVVVLPGTGFGPPSPVSLSFGLRMLGSALMILTGMGLRRLGR